MEELPAFLSTLETMYGEILDWLIIDFFTYTTLAQLAVIALGLLASWLLAGLVVRTLARVREEVPTYARFAPVLEPLLAPLIALLLIGTARFAAGELAMPRYLLGVATNLLTAWLVIRLAVNFIRSEALRHLMAVLALSVAALNILGLLEPIIRALDAARLNLGEVSISALAVLNGILAFFLLIWIALLIARLVESRVDRLYDVNPSTRELIKKLARISLLIVAFVLALNATGIDFTALAVFTGALGVGIGFGLQKVVSNFVSGVILLMDHSIKPGDVIETQGTFGWINHLGARYTSIITREGTEYLIPNEDMITQPVINWSFSDRKIRRSIPISVSYKTNLRRAMTIMEEVSLTVERVLKNPAPVVRLIEFGDNGVELELRFWIEDPQLGVANVASEVMLSIWDRFHEEGIEFPYPQRVVH
ncbi:MAG: mechanosensitive ion channel domain-containing protein, partial [Gammaproteobacteria bacterium]